MEDSKHVPRGIFSLPNEVQMIELLHIMLKLIIDLIDPALNLLAVLYTRAATHHPDMSALPLPHSTCTATATSDRSGTGWLYALPRMPSSECETDG